MERTRFDPAHGGADILIIRTLILTLLSLIINGCNVPSEPLPYPLTINEEGLGAIHYNIPFDQVNNTLSGFTFEKLSQISPDQRQIIYQIKRGKNIVANILSDTSGKKIAEIQVVSPLIKNKYAQGLGDILPSSKTLQCIDDRCTNVNEPSVHYRIDRNTRTIKEITFSRL